MDDAQDWHLATSVLRLATQLVDGVQEGLAERGFTDVRPAHGFAFVRIARGPTTIAELAEHLGITKQAGSQLVAQLEARGYVAREGDPRDRRAQLLTLTERGQACTKAARQAAVGAVRRARSELDPDDVVRLRRLLDALVEPGPLRPSW